MVKVFLREKKLKHDKIGLYLDFYPPIVVGGKQTRREHLGLNIFAKPKTQLERDENKGTRLLAENVRSQRQLELQAGQYGFTTTRAKQGDFLKFFRQIVELKKRTSVSNHYNWVSACNRFEDFVQKKCRFNDVTEELCSEYKNYLIDNFSINTAGTYFIKFKTVLKTAVEKKLFPADPAKKVGGIKPEEAHKEFLTLEELQKLANADFRYENLKRAALFSALTGLRYSDIAKLVWREIQHGKSQGYYIRFAQQKTKQLETLPISDEAFALLGNRDKPEAKVFSKLRYAQTRYLSLWTTAAGIEKDVTFHSFRHTYATLQLTLGTDLYTVSKMLGHKNISTTQIYAKIIDEKKREAANKISLK